MIERPFSFRVHIAHTHTQYVVYNKYQVCDVWVDYCVVSFKLSRRINAPSHYKVSGLLQVGARKRPLFLLQRVVIKQKYPRERKLGIHSGTSSRD